MRYKVIKDICPGISKGMIAEHCEKTDMYKIKGLEKWDGESESVNVNGKKYQQLEDTYLNVEFFQEQMNNEDYFEKID